MPNKCCVSFIAVLQALVVVTDGGSSTGVDALLNAAEILKKSGKRIFVVGLGKYEHFKNMRLMASDPEKSHIFLANKGKDLPSLVKKLTKAVCGDFKPSLKHFEVSENGEQIMSVLYNNQDQN